jgi:transposase InsO family protein
MEGSLVSHSRAKLNAYGRRLLCERIQAGFPVRVAARMLGISHARAYLIWGLYRDIGERAFEPRSSRPHHSPRRTPAPIERRIERLRRRKRRGPARIAFALGLARSTVYAVLRRLGLNHLRVLRPPRPAFRRYERPVPGDLGHLDAKELANVGDGDGHRVRDRASARRHRGVGTVTQFALTDDRTRVTFRAELPSEDAACAAVFLGWALDFFRGLGVRFRQLMTDGHKAYRSLAFQRILAAERIDHILTPPYTPRWNGKVERYFRTMLEEAAYARAYASDADRRRALARFDHDYNFRRPHSSLGGLTPMQRLADDIVNNVRGQYI